MDSIFGIGGPELILILLLAGIVMGPERIYSIAKWLGKTTAQLQAISRGFARQLSAELDAVDAGGEIKGAAREMKDLQRQISELRQELKSVAKTPMREANAALKQGEAVVENSILPPKKEAAAENGTSENGTAVSAPATPAPTPAVTSTPPPPPLPQVVEVEDDPD